MDEQNKRKRIWRIVLILCLLLFLAAAAVMVLYLFPFDATDTPSAPVDATTTTTTTAVVLPDNPIDFVAKKAENPHIIGWIQIPGTVIDYPILQSGNDVEENFYLNHGPDRQTNRNGSIYIQRINSPDFTQPNTLIYGHNMANGSMFAALHKFKKADFFEENQYVYVYIPGHVLTYRIFSVFVYDNRHILNSFNFFDPKEYQDFLDQSLNPVSMTKQVREGVSVTTEDRIITLSTCTARDSERLLLEGVLIDDQLTN